MTSKDYTAWSEKYLMQSFMTLHGKRISICATPPSTKPLILLVHGISGDFNGLVPLAAELVSYYRVVFIDLPGHGRSDEIPLPTAKTLQAWFEEALRLIEQELGPVDFIAAHSFGCSVVLSPKVLAAKKVALVNPVPTPSVMYAKYARAIMDSAHFWAHVYNWRLFVVLRGMTLAKNRTREAMQRVRWVGLRSKASYAQIVFQSRLVNIILDASAYKQARQGTVSLVVCGLSDTTARERDSLDMRNVFGNTPVLFLRGGHLLPMESPEAVARLIRETMVH